MTTIDERIVSMKFQNSSFLNGIKSTIAAMAGLKKGLNVDGAAKGLDALNKTASKFPPAAMSSGIQGLSSRFLALSTIGITALSNITNRAVDAGLTIARSLTVDPIKLGLEEYETNLNSIQTILANTGLEGDKGLAKVSSKLQELNEYSDQTIYNFSEMARNIGTFTAAGVDLDTSTSAIKGIANLAAISGSNSQQASTAMYQLSQALSAGKVTLEDWNSVVNAGMGGQIFRDSLMETARVHGVAIDSIVQEAGSFRESLQEGWISAEILTETLSKFTGELNKEQLKAMGYNEEQIAGIIKMGQTATDAATKVKTMSQLIGTLQEAAQSGWAETWQAIFGDFNEAKELFTNVNDVLGAMIGASSDARNELVSDWKKLGGRTVIIEAIGNAFKGLLDLIRPIRSAFRDIFPPATGKQLYDISVTIRDFTETLTLSEKTSKQLRTTFGGFFAVLSIGWQILKGVATSLGIMFGAFDGGGNILTLSSNIGDFLIRLDEAIKRGDDLTKFFEELGQVLAVPIALLSDLTDLLTGGLGSGGGGKGLEVFLEKANTRLEPFGFLLDGLIRAWNGLGRVVDAVWRVIQPFASGIAEVFQSLGKVIAEAISNSDYNAILDTINTGLFAVIALAIKNFLSDGKLFDFGGGGDGFLDSIKDAFGGLTDTLSAMQANLKSGTLIKIAGAIALLTASVVALSLIDSGNLTKALTALTVMFVQLGAAMVAFEAVTTIKSVLKLGPMAAGLILLATAILILSGAVKIMSTLSWEEIAKGLVGVTGALGALAGAAKLLSGVKGLTLAGAGLIALAIGVSILAGAVKIFSTFSWEEMLKGLAGVAGSLLIIAGAMSLMPATLPLTGAGLLIVAVALTVLAGALKIMGSFSWEEIGKSMVVLAGSLVILAGAMYLMTAGLPGAAAMLVMAPALVILAGALKIMASLSWEEIGKVMTVLAGALIILAVTVTAMIAALPGAAALLVISAALAILTPVLIALGNMSWGEIGKGLTALAAALAIIGIAGAVLTPVIPTLLGLGVAITLIGVGILAAGVGVLAFAAGLTALSVAGVAGAAAVIVLGEAIISLIPSAMAALATGIVAFANVISTAGPTFTAAMTTLILSLLTAINKLAPKIITTLYRLILHLANTVANNYPKFVDAGLRLITGILNGIANNIEAIVMAAISIVTNFINGVSKSLPKVTESGANLVISFVESLADTIRNNSSRMRTAGLDLAGAIIDGMTGGLFSGAGSIASAAANMASQAIDSAKSILGIASPSKEFKKLGRFVTRGFADGLVEGSKRDVKAANKALRGFLKDTIRDTNQDVKEAKERLAKLTAARNKDTAAINRARKALKESVKERDRARNVLKYTLPRLEDENKKLEKVARNYKRVTDRLANARQELANARKTRDDYAASVKDQFGDLGQIRGQTLRGFTSSLEIQLNKTRAFNNKMAKLRKLGISDELYEELLQRGPDAIPLINDILEGGREGVQDINKLAKSLAYQSKKLGRTAAKELYQAGVDTARGIVEGLKKRQKALQKQMEKLANIMVNSIKRQLGIRSPSKEFAKIGEFSTEGLAKGLRDSSKTVSTAAENVGENALDAMRKSIRNVGKVFDNDVDLTPRIQPVVDLTDVKSKAKTISGMFGSVPLTTEASYANAARISNTQVRSPRFTDTDETPVASSVTNFNYTQNNTSPESLSPSTVYRQTKNQLSTVKEALGVSN